jgi:transposase
MAEYTIHSEYASIVAMDVHARTTTVKGIDFSTGEEKLRRFNNCPSAIDIATWIRENFTGPQYCAYESGCTGFHLCRELNKLGMKCDVIAVSTIARSTDDQQRKTDRKDAKRLLSELVAPHSSLSAVWLPSDECEGMRDLLRACADASGALRRSKQQLSSLLLRHGWVWNEKTASGNLKATWGADHKRWLDNIELDSEFSNETLSFYRNCVEEDKERLERLMKRVRLYAELKRFKPYVDAFTCIRGVALYSAMVAAAEFDDFLRFKSGGAVSKWSGFTPKSHASGTEKASNGHITKAGSVHLRNVIIEGVSSIGRRSPAPVRLKSNQIASEHIRAECAKCNRRLYERYLHLTGDLKKHPNVAKCAIASELVRWIWAIGRLVQLEQEAL